MYCPADATATHSLSLASVKSRLVIPFWYRLTGVVLDKGPLNGCVFSCEIACFYYYFVMSVRLSVSPLVVCCKISCIIYALLYDTHE